MPNDTVKLNFSPQTFTFSAAHFTIFSETKRERLHGHNYSVAATLHIKQIKAHGITFDYTIFKRKLKQVCQQLDSYCLLPEKSPYLHIIDHDPHYKVEFNQETMFFLKKDTLLLPITNTTLEILSQWFLNQLANDLDFIQQHDITALSIQVFNTPNQSATSCTEITSTNDAIWE